MARSKKIHKRIALPDPIYQSKILGKLINGIMEDGKKSIALKQVYKAMDIVAVKTKTDNILNYVRQSLENIKPLTEIKSRRVGGAAYQVPIPVKGDRRESLAIRWIILAAKARANKEYHTFAEKLAAELMDAYNNLGGAIKKKQDIHHMADANKAFSHFRW